MKKQRKHYTPEEKVAILRRQLLDKEPISKLCDELGLQPTVFYRWQKEFFENGLLPSSRKHGRTIPPSRNGSPTLTATGDRLRAPSIPGSITQSGRILLSFVHSKKATCPCDSPHCLGEFHIE